MGHPSIIFGDELFNVLNLQVPVSVDLASENI